MKNFDQFIGIDWSGAKSPIYTKSIAVAACEQGEKAPHLIQNDQKENAQNRNLWSRNDVFEYIQTLKERTLIGIDANFGYAQEIGLNQFKKSYNFNDLWSAVEKLSTHNDNFFANGFWENYPEYFWTEGKQPEHITLPKRTTETQCGEAGYGWPESPFKLLGPKQVGKGGLAAMRMAYALKRKMGDTICIWPFEQEIADTAQIVVTEIYPRQFLRRTGHGNAKVNTLDELNEALKQLKCKNKYDTMRFNDHDADAIVAAAGIRMLCGNQKNIPEDISNPKAMNKQSATREGWIFGV